MRVIAKVTAQKDPSRAVGAPEAKLWQQIAAKQSAAFETLGEVASLAKPLNFPDSFTENISNTFLDSSNALFRRLSLVGGVLQTPFALDNVTFSALLLLTRKNLASRNK